MSGSGNLHHVGYCVELADLASAGTWFSDALGAEFAEYVRPDLGLHILLAWQEGIELIAPLDEPGSASGPVRDFLDRHGPGVFSVVVRVGDLETAVASAVSLGARVVSRQSESNGEIGFVLEEATLAIPASLPLTLLETDLS